MGTNVIEAVGRVEAAAQKPNEEKRVVTSIEIGCAVRQGDIYLTRIPDGAARGKELQDRQLAPGTSQGSRHVVAGEGVRVFAAAGPRPELARGALLGPIVVAEQTFTVTHPEHAHFELPAGTYQCSFQMDPRTLARVED